MSLHHHAATASSSNIFASGSQGVLPSDLEQRRQRRARANWASRLVNTAGNVVHGRVCDVSEGGFGMMSNVHMPVGATMDVVLAVPKSAACDRSVPVRCKVRVVSCAFTGVQSRLSAQFLDLPKEARLAIRSYVISHA